MRLLEDSFVKIAGVVLGERTAKRINDDRVNTQNAVDAILKYYHYRTTDLPEDDDEDIASLMERCLRTYGIMQRVVSLTKGWYRDAFGPILAFTREGGVPTVLLPLPVQGYAFTDPVTGKTVRLGRKNEELFDTEAYCFYRPLPQKSLTVKDLLLYMKQCISLGDIVMIVAATFAVTAVGMILPMITKALTGPVLSSGRRDALIGIAVSIFCILFSSQLITGAKGMIQSRLSIKTSVGVQSAMMMRLMSLPANFFRQYSPGELKNRASSVNNLCSLMMNMLMSTGLTSLASLLYVGQIFAFAPSLVVPALVIVIVTVAVSMMTTLIQIRINRSQLERGAKESGVSYSLISGIQKVKLAGAEKRVFAKWLDIYSDVAELQYNPPMLIKINSVITLAISLISNIVLYYLAVQNGVDQSSYFAFTAAYGMLMGAFMSLAGIARQVAQIQPIFEMAEPFLKVVPETSESRETVNSITGGIELNHVSFRYSPDSPYILKDLSLKVNPGEYVAIVGRTGCGKSTLVRLLLGFEKPETGVVFYDDRDISELDMPSLRRKIGTVMQDDGLFQGDIYSNIVIGAPWLTLDDAWEAAEKAGIAEDIRNMPMGMHTIISEGGGGISGGQKQRIMIARAIAHKPKLLIFDEATSALDNKTQRQVSEALDAMGCTRLVIAHRLSTIRHCDRILVLDGGSIIEDGSYDELMKKDGVFAELVRRQQ